MVERSCCCNKEYRIGGILYRPTTMFLSYRDLRRGIYLADTNFGPEDDSLTEAQL